MGKEITIYDIAKALNLSAATVSRGLKDHPAIRRETRQRITEAAQSMGYQHNVFASNLRRKQTYTIGVVVPRLNSYWMSEVIAGMEKVANQQGYQLIISQSQEAVGKEAANVQTLYNSRVDGLLVSLSGETESLQHFDLLHKKGIPLVFFDRVAEVPGCSAIVIDNFWAAYEATRHLLQQGCRRIVHLGGSQVARVYAERYQGYRKALADFEVDFDPKLHMISDLSSRAAVSAQHMLRMNLPPDGLFAANDTSAVAVMSEFKRAGFRIPEDLAVVGFNDDPVSRVVEPLLSTVHYPGTEMGELAATHLIQKLKNPEAPLNPKIVLPHRLIVRASSDGNQCNF